MLHAQAHENNIWDTLETTHSRTFFQNLMKMSECFRMVVEDIIMDGNDEYDVTALIEIEDTTRATVDMYDTGFLPTSFYLYSALGETKGTPEEVWTKTKKRGGSDPSQIWIKVRERDDNFFAGTLASFFTEKAREEFLSGYLDLFDRKNSNGELLVNSEDREILWDWIHTLVKTTIQHEHKVRGPIIIRKNGEEVFTHRIHPEDSERLINYAEIWNVDIFW